jgi:O-antigen/teichoic acid export membrane protein
VTGTRGRLTPVDVVLYGSALLILALLAEPFYELLDTSSLDTATELLFVMIPAGLIVSLLFVIYRTSVIGGGGA